MKRWIASAFFAVSFALPAVSQARSDRQLTFHGYRDNDRGSQGDGRDRYAHYDQYDRHDRYDHGGHYESYDRYDGHRGSGWHGRGPVHVVGEIIALPFVIGATVIGATVNALTSPLRHEEYVEDEPAYYGPPRVVYESDPYEVRRGRVVAPPPVYYEPEYRRY